MRSSRRGHPAWGSIVARGPWAPSAVRATWDPSRAPLPPELEARVAATWSAALASAAAEGRVLFPGPLAALASASGTTAGLALALRPTDYRELVGTNLSADYPRSSPRSDALGLTIVPRTSDARIV